METESGGKDTLTEQQQERTRSGWEKHREVWALDLYTERNAQEGQPLPLTGAARNAQ